MQDRYVGDAGDFAKYGLLRQLIGMPASAADLKLGVVGIWLRMKATTRTGATCPISAIPPSGSAILNYMMC